MRLGRPLVLLVVAVALSAVVASLVTYLLVGRSVTGARKALPPVVLTGVLRDTSGKPVANAWVQLTAFDDANSKVGQPIPIHAFAGAHTDAAGRFTIRQAQSGPFLRKLAAENGGWVNFDVDFSADGHTMPWGIPRQISHRTWLADDQGTPAARKKERITFKPF